MSNYFERIIDIGEAIKDVDIETIKKNINLKIQINSNNCWEWKGDKTKANYGRIHIKNRALLAHRVSFFIYNGNIPKSYTIDHLCKNTNCVNPAHLEAVTMKENTLRGTSFASVNAKKTHCVNGHELTNENTFIYKNNGRRGCKMCMKKQGRDNYLKNKEVIKNRVKQRYLKLKTIKNEQNV